MVAGTPLYMAPEQARGEALDHRTDLFSLGSVLYAMCTGKPPFQGSTPFMVLRQVTEEVPAPVQQTNPETPDWLGEVIDRLLAKKPADRFQTAAEVAEVLARHLQQLPEAPSVKPAALTRRTGRLRGVHRGWYYFWVVSGAAFWLALATLTVTELTGLTHFMAWLAPAYTGQRPRATLSAQTGPVWAVAFAPDGERLAMALDDGTVKIWDVNAERVVATLNAHKGPVWGVAFSPDGKTLATSSDDNTVKLWKVGTWSKLGVLTHEAAVRPLAFSPDSKTLVTGGRNNRVILWDVADPTSAEHTRRLLGEHNSVVMAVAFSPDGKTVASASGDRTAKLWDVDSGQEQVTLTGHQSGLHAVAFSSDNRTVATGSWDRTVRLWDAATGRELATLPGHTQLVWSVAFAPDGLTLASGSEDHTIKLWDVHTHKELRTLRGHTGTVSAVTFARDGATLASGGRDGTVKLWDARP
jgi:WD40 repeat protein